MKPYSSEMDALLGPEELEYAIEHALRVHSLAEEDRSQLREATSVATLREILLECELPEEDVDSALASLATALKRRRVEGRRRRRMTILGIAASLAILAVIVVVLTTWSKGQEPARSVDGDSSTVGSQYRKHQHEREAKRKGRHR